MSDLERLKFFGSLDVVVFSSYNPNEEIHRENCTDYERIVELEREYQGDYVNVQAP